MGGLQSSYVTLSLPLRDRAIFMAIRDRYLFPMVRTELTMTSESGFSPIGGRYLRRFRRCHAYTSISQVWARPPTLGGAFRLQQTGFLTFSSFLQCFRLPPHGSGLRSTRISAGAYSTRWGHRSTIRTLQRRCSRRRSLATACAGHHVSYKASTTTVCGADILFRIVYIIHLI